MHFLFFLQRLHQRLLENRSAIESAPSGGTKMADRSENKPTGHGTFSLDGLLIGNTF